jgi:hypothetical protein
LPAYVPTSGLVGYWPFCGNANDESGNGNNGTVNGATLTTDRNGVANQAYNFDGIDDKIIITAQTSIPQQSNYTASLWFKSAISDYNGAFISFGTWFCKLGHDSPGFFYKDEIGNSSNNWYEQAHFGVQPTVNTWNNLILKKTNNTVTLILNNSIIGSMTTYGFSNFNPSSLIQFGYYCCQNYFAGSIDDIGVWNRALTDCEIQNLYTSTNPTNTTTITACDSYTWNGTSYSASGTYTGTTSNCVTESLNLTITPSSTNTTTATACESYTWNGTTYTATGVYTGATTNCVTESLDLTITPSSANTTAISACDSYLWNGTNYTSSGVYTGTTSNCVTESLNLTITPSSTNTTPISACDSYLWNGTTYTTSGVYTGTTTNCIAESLNLTITPSSTNTTTATACNSYIWNGTTYTESGVYTGTTANCITESLDLTITPSSTNTTTASACDTYVWNGTTYTESGVYTGTTTNCIAESLNLTITPSSTNTTTASACNSYTWNGQTYTTSGVYTGTTTNCVTESLNLTITPSSTNTTTASACNSYVWNGTSYSASGVYTGTTANCVTQALNLTINSSTSSSISQTALDSYTWPVNNQTYTTTGAYTAVIPNASGCDSTITLNLTMSFTGINDLSASKLTIYPNPTNSDFTITGLELLGTVSSLTLTDMNGKVVKVLDTKATKFSMGSIKPGVYFLNIISGNKQEVLKIVKE